MRNDGRRVWILSEGKPIPVEVKTGASDGTRTKLLAGELQPGQAVVIDATSIEK
jgi:HlyD family secretion protein